MGKEEMLDVFGTFTEKNDFRLNPDAKHVDMILNGLMANEKKYGLKFCPCRLRDGTKETDLGLLCPCNFKAQDVWQKQQRCWCGLFVKR